MESEGNDHAEPWTVFVSDPSVEAERVSQALREAKLHVVDVPLSMLVARVAVQRPNVVLVDADAEGAVETVGRMRELPSSDAIDVIFLGRAGEAMSTSEDAIANEGSGFFSRPIDPAAVVKKIQALAMGEAPAPAPEPVEPPPPSDEKRPPSSPPPASARPPPPSSRPPPPSARPPPPSSRPPPSMRSPIPNPAPSQARVSLRTGISEELENLLAAADVRAQGHGSAGDLGLVSPEDELDAVLPEAILAALDTPLDDDAEEEEGEQHRGTGDGRSTTSRGRAAASSAEASGSTGEEAAPEPVTNGGVGTNAGSTGETGQRVEAQGTSATGPTTGSGTSTSLRSNENTASATASQQRSDLHPFGVAPPPSPPAATPFTPRRPKSSIPPPFGGPSGQPSAPLSPFPSAGVPSVMSTTLGSEILVQAGGMLLPMVQLPTSVPAGPPPSLERRLEPPPPPMAPLPVPSLPLSPPQPSSAVASSAVATPPLSGPEAPPTAPTALGPGDGPRALARAIAHRQSGSLTFEAPEGVRRVVLREGDIITAASGIDGESLLAFLGARGELPRERIEALSGRLPPYGRHAGAALVAQGALAQDQLWPVLRAHAEWIMAQALSLTRGSSFLDPEPPGRLRNEPSVFGGSPGAEVFVEVIRRSIDEPTATAALGGRDTTFAEGPRATLLNECGLGGAELDAIRSVIGARLDEVVARFPQTDVTQVLYALALLGIVVVVRPAFANLKSGARAPRVVEADAMDNAALRERIRARIDLVEEGDYFALLGVMRNATSYEIRRAYLDLRRAFEPAAVLTPATLDLAEDVRRIVAVLDEAYEILGDNARRERYRRAIDDSPN